MWEDQGLDLLGPHEVIDKTLKLLKFSYLTKYIGYIVIYMQRNDQTAYFRAWKYSKLWWVFVEVLNGASPHRM